MNWIINKYKSLNPKLKASFWFMLCNILQKGVALLTTPIFTRILTSEQYGQYSNYQSWYSILIIFATLNLYGGVYNNGMIKYEDNRISFTSSIQGLSITSTIICFIVYIINYKWWNDWFQLSIFLIVMMFLDFVFSPSYSFWLLRNRFDYNYKSITAVTIISTLINPILAIYVVINTEYKVEARVACHTLVVIAFALPFFVYHFAKGRKFYDRQIWKYALNFNLPLIPHYLSQIVLQQSDRIMITRLVGPSQTAYYSVAYSVSMLIMIITNAINSSLIPYIYQNIKLNNYNKIKNISLKLTGLIASGCLVAVLITPEIIRLFATSEYYDAIWVMPPVCISVYFMFIFGLFSNVEFYFEKTKGIMFASIIAAIVNILLNYWLIPILGYFAAGYTTLMSYILLSIMHYIIYRKTLITKKKAHYYPVDKILLISIITVTMMIVFSFTYLNRTLRYCLIVLLVLAVLTNYKKIVKNINIKGDGE